LGTIKRHDRLEDPTRKSCRIVPEIVPPHLFYSTHSPRFWQNGRGIHWKELEDRIKRMPRCDFEHITLVTNVTLDVHVGVGSGVRGPRLAGTLAPPGRRLGEGGEGVSTPLDPLHRNKSIKTRVS